MKNDYIKECYKYADCLEILNSPLVPPTKREKAVRLEELFTSNARHLNHEKLKNLAIENYKELVKLYNELIKEARASIEDFSGFEHVISEIKNRA